MKLGGVRRFHGWKETRYYLKEEDRKKRGGMRIALVPWSMIVLADYTCTESQLGAARHTGRSNKLQGNIRMTPQRIGSAPSVLRQTKEFAKFDHNVQILDLRIENSNSTNMWVKAPQEVLSADRIVGTMTVIRAFSFGTAAMTDYVESRFHGHKWIPRLRAAQNSARDVTEMLKDRPSTREARNIESANRIRDSNESLGNAITRIMDAPNQCSQNKHKQETMPISGTGSPKAVRVGPALIKAASHSTQNRDSSLFVLGYASFSKT
ncbi:hypothetical protein GUITHDRAFT_141782 [Guillardia theta CCMP2712]|uniref:Uncharacterized protein n=1 Tax=Guillardia theta (strain CCMP2712) TaxID=905079 RepID=L1J000_GUITC|nr:hypothetical protein GUITHDRAFT_141782 [Guillardia theta CCMP2712]EKX41796.1 hypothetical protein GUITHDRAFT_141782 [Guillardia theta CCMP2712]|eukprot:XP_005828776.1 hypothetical protein GUITHDRAFT_141782 [Guillardia theta CCMP2712]